MLVSCKEDSRKSAHRKRNVKVICQVALVLFTGPTKTAVPSVCFANNKRDRNGTCTTSRKSAAIVERRMGRWWRLGSGAE